MVCHRYLLGLGASTLCLRRLAQYPSTEYHGIASRHRSPGYYAYILGNFNISNEEQLFSSVHSLANNDSDVLPVEDNGTTNLTGTGEATSETGKEEEVVNEPYNGNRMRNFCIIAHVDHGKSTLADRFLELTKAVEPHEIQGQYLDNMELERERGITIKLQSALIKYTYPKDGQVYSLNLIDTPGHIDFNHEARRSIAACEGAILVVDGTKGIQAQTVTTSMIAIEAGLKLIPVVNKIDVPFCDYESTVADLTSLFDFSEDEILMASAKEGFGINEILDAVVERIPPPKINLDRPFRALVFDSQYDPHRGVVSYVRVSDGIIKKLDDVVFLGHNLESRITAVGVMMPELRERDVLRSGEVGWLCSNTKDPSKVAVGDTVALKSAVKDNNVEPLVAFAPAKPSVFAGLYPCDGSDYMRLSVALEKLKLNDHSIVFEPSESSIAGHGFKCGFNGLLHLDVTVQRLQREFDVGVIVTSPSVPYKCILKNGKEITVSDAAHWPEEGMVKVSMEPWTNVTVRIPGDCHKKVSNLLTQMRGEFQKKSEFAGGKSLVLEYKVPMIEIISTFFDNLKSMTNGFGSFDYEGTEYREIDLCKLRVLINGEEAGGLSMLVARDNAYKSGRLLVETLREVIPPKQFKINLQAAIGKRVIAALSIPALRKNVTERCSGGDPSRKRKLLENQAKGKKYMAEIGNVSIPFDAYKAVHKALR
ncbi:GTP-binding protein LepA family protein [Babesia bovis T2Bo]|uniref:Translation factor GUF1 homolog, mitochondrial n=1 Tax=Babesia bovis TaxID=5865 RepID=GUF1_BABBO|nr:GTP-binding protein LepA family protein [Babesia bovis T2Bo]A7AQ93.1 RecName: Full=Translation factor GUF1 homolog, mitochondrial; AltName: Full=Elongation factor 4 homolog; Short=EF-4; AltName: Full=GTPase GUF1 homolog; AltName: Full=Ribosomal back-translocase; Flags: Precursor [Babesia bovis]EDO08727.1 GTP-binding protein LepA family protein [Babesia bovis T2Bo]|eukprot:XP_001612295.1 GTP-binding protein LepA family protein [Babesia bovis T2Bo]